jgi:hypothetical protein
MREPSMKLEARSAQPALSFNLSSCLTVANAAAEPCKEIKATRPHKDMRRLYTHDVDHRLSVT